MVREASAAITAPIVMFTYYNPIMARGLERFCAQARDAGAAGALERGGGGREGGYGVGGGWGAGPYGAGAAPCVSTRRWHASERAAWRAPAAHPPAPPCPVPPHPPCSPGLLVPDIPLEETDSIRGVAAAHGLELVLLTTPTTPQARMQRIALASQGFVYLVSLTGVQHATGAPAPVPSLPRSLPSS